MTTPFNELKNLSFSEAISHRNLWVELTDQQKRHFIPCDNQDLYSQIQARQMDADIKREAHRVSFAKKLKKEFDKYGAENDWLY